MRIIDRFEPAFVSVPAKTVEFENGEQASVDGFEIAMYPTTIGMMQSFCDETGYRTAPERAGLGREFVRNETNEHLSGADLLAAPACCVSWADACAFCEWAGVRLPSEAEWVAAALVDETVYRTLEDAPYWRRGVLDFTKLGPCVRLGFREWTATQDILPVEAAAHPGAAQLIRAVAELFRSPRK